MPRKSNKICGRCRFLYNEEDGFGNCYYSGDTSSPQEKSCSRFEAGEPFVPTFRDKEAQVIPLTPGEAAAFLFPTGKNGTLALMYDVDRNGYGFFRVKLIGFHDGGGMKLKRFAPDKGEDFAFFGEVAVTGARNSDLFRSADFDDEDHADEEGNIDNKPKEILILPRRK